MKTGLIYIIRNTENYKVYIGQTTLSLQDRWKQHKKPSTAKRRKNYKLYNAINYYGINKFYCELIEDNIDIDLLNEKEIFYIAFYNSYYDGYNSTKGGDGRIINNDYDEQAIVQLYHKGFSTYKIASLYEVSFSTICRILHKNHIETRIDGRKLTDEMFNEVKIYAINHTYKETAIQYNVNEKTIRRFLKKHNFFKRDFSSTTISKESRVEDEFPLEAHHFSNEKKIQSTPLEIVD